VSPLPSLLSPSRRILTATPRAAPSYGHPCSAPTPASSPPRPQVAVKSGKPGVPACARGNQRRPGITHHSRMWRAPWRDVVCPGRGSSPPIPCPFPRARPRGPWWRAPEPSPAVCLAVGELPCWMAIGATPCAPVAVAAAWRATGEPALGQCSQHRLPPMAGQTPLRG
jgi:hypothetical protein